MTMPAGNARMMSSDADADARLPLARPGDILALATSSDPWSPAVDAAITLAARWGANLTSCYVDPSLRHVDDPDLEPSVLGLLLQPRGEDDGECAAFASHAHRLGVREASWVVTRASIPLTLRVLGAWHDLAVIERDIAPGAHLFNILDEAMLASRLACLLLPPDWSTDVAPARMAIGWNGSIEAARAMHRALPFLQEAAEVRIIDGQEPHASDDDTTPAALRLDPLDYLRRHGVSAKSLRLDASPQQAGAALLQEAQHMHADLLVMGAYSHSHLRERVLGGATRHVLMHAQIPAALLDTHAAPRDCHCKRADLAFAP